MARATPRIAVRSSRTQAERREATIRKLLDAATEVLVDLGYSRATAQAICARAGVSQGALFRHFPTVEALMVTLCEDLGRRVLERYKKTFEAAGHGPSTTGGTAADPLYRAMVQLRAQCRSTVNQAWYELAIAARTNRELQRALEPVAKRYYEDIEGLARELLPDLASALGERFSVLVDTVVCVFDGEAVQRFVVGKPDLDDRRIDALAGALHLVAASGSAEPRADTRKPMRGPKPMPAPKQTRTARSTPPAKPTRVVRRTAS